MADDVTLLSPEEITAELYQHRYCEWSKCRVRSALHTSAAYHALCAKIDADVAALAVAIEVREREGWEHEAACARTARVALMALLPSVQHV